MECLLFCFSQQSFFVTLLAHHQPLTHNSLSGEVLLLLLVVKPLIANDGRDGWLIVIIAL